MKKKSNKGLALGTAFGAVAGVVAGLLFAPKSGKETRKDIKDEASKALKAIEAEKDKLHKELGELIAAAEKKVNGTKSKVTDKSSELLVSAKHVQKSLAEVASAVKKGQSKDEDLDKAVKQAKDVRDSLKKYLKK